MMIIEDSEILTKLDRDALWPMTRVSGRGWRGAKPSNVRRDMRVVLRLPRVSASLTNLLCVQDLWGFRRERVRPSKLPENPKGLSTKYSVKTALALEHRAPYAII